MVEAHERHPAAAAIGGSVENGATGCALDWASFIVVQAPIMTPIESGETNRVAGAVNVSYKRAAIGTLDDFDGLGAMDVLHQRALRASGHRFIADDSIRVVHDQSLGLSGTVVLHYHAGRTFAAFVKRRPGLMGAARMAGVLIVPYVRFARAVGIGRRKGYGPVIRGAWPAMLALFLIQAAGQIAGFAFGPGDSPRRVQ
jgi:hypothetical protein